VVSQVTSACYLFNGYVDEAKKVHGECLGTLTAIVDGLPAVGRVKGAIPYIGGDRERRYKAIKAASRTTGTLERFMAAKSHGNSTGTVCTHSD
jgi:hypothetical protein